MIALNIPIWIEETTIVDKPLGRCASHFDIAIHLMNGSHEVNISCFFNRTIGAPEFVELVGLHTLRTGTRVLTSPLPHETSMVTRNPTPAVCPWVSIIETTDDSFWANCFVPLGWTQNHTPQTDTKSLGHPETLSGHKMQTQLHNRWRMTSDGWGRGASVSWKWLNAGPVFMDIQHHSK